jgi:hypothetical protein
MEFDQYMKSDPQPKKQKLSKHKESFPSSEENPVSRFGALLAASLLRLPDEAKEYRMIEEYSHP